MDESVRNYIGIETEEVLACDPVEAGAVRRFAQAYGDIDPIYRDSDARFGGPVAPLIYPSQMFRRDFYDADPIDERASDPDFDGLGQNATQGLPAIEPLAHLSSLNGGNELEFFRFARHGERVTLKSRYADIYERETSKGKMIFVITESEYRGEGGDLIVRATRTQIRR